MTVGKQKLIDIFKKHRPNTQMSEDETRFMINVMLSKDEKFDVEVSLVDKGTYNQFETLINSFQGKVFLKRLEVMTSLKISISAFIIMMHHFNNVAQVVMYAWYLNHKLPANTLIVMDTIGEVFSLGFFSEEQLNQIWKEQKQKPDGGSDNLIDDFKVWE